MRELLCWFVRLSGLPLFIRSLVQRGRVTVLLYHRPSAETADRHFQILRRLYTPISLQSYLNARRDPWAAPLPPRPLIVTIDDGHSSVYSLASVLAKHKIPITVFLCSGLVGTTRRFWFSCPGLTDSGREQLKTVPDSERLQALRILGFDETAETGQAESLTVTEIHELMHVIDFQSHGVTHPILPACSDRKALAEIVESKAELESTLRLPVNALAYPNGSYSGREVAFTRDAGYECGLTTKPGFNTTQTPLLELKRLTVSDHCGTNELIVRASGVWALLRGIARIGGVLPVSQT